MYYFHSVNEREIQSEFSDVVEESLQQLKNRMAIYEYGLRGLRGAVVTVGHDKLNHASFHEYGQSRDPDLEFPGARGIAFVRRIKPSQEFSWLNNIRGEGFKVEQIRQLSPHDGDRFVVQYIHPVSKNKNAIGLDIASEFNRRETIWKSISQGQATLTRPITLVQGESNPKQGFLLMLPVFDSGTTPLTEDARQQAAVGIVDVPLVIGEVLADLGLNKGTISLSLFDVQEGSEPQLFFSSSNVTQPSLPNLSREIPFQIYGRDWIVEIKGLPSLLQGVPLINTRIIAAGIFAIGIVLSILLQFYLTAKKKEQTRALDQVAKRAVDLARQREIEVSASIQQRLLFGVPPTDIPGFSISSYSEASQGIDGDFYTFTRLGGDSFEILTGDVMGKGITAAMIGAGIKASYRRHLVEFKAHSKENAFPSPEQLINLIHHEVTPELIKLNSFVTLSLLRFDHSAMTLTMVNAGHTPALQVSKNGQCLNKLAGDNLPIGVIENEVYKEQVFPIQIGDYILSYSDGISESVSPQGDLYGETRIETILQAGQQIEASSSIFLHSLRSDIHDFTERLDGNDDRTAIVVQIRPLRSKIRSNITDRKELEYIDLPRQFDQLSRLRQRIADLAQDQPEEFIQALILAAFEAATNIIRHTPEKLLNTPFTAVLKRDQTELSVDLVYAGQPFVQEAPPSPDFSGGSDGGFGLFIIENSVDRVIYSRPMPGLASILMIKKLDLPQEMVID
jgi:CHASE1-domain containing sensor protein/serine phosphatase RsbU (regulator of sigma subunit)/anti-sigma regulatory factor (Ser/Thr protein kinase)